MTKIEHGLKYNTRATRSSIYPQSVRISRLQINVYTTFAHTFTFNIHNRMVLLGAHSQTDAYTYRFYFFFAHISQNEIINVSKDPVRPPYMVVYNTFGASAKNERHTPKRNSNLFLGYPLTAQTMGSKKYDVPFQRIRILWLSRLHHSCGMAVCGVCVLMYLDTCHTRRYVRYFVTGTGGQLVSDEQKHEWFVLIFRFVWDNCALANVGLRFGIGFGMITTNIYL